MPGSDIARASAPTLGGMGVPESGGARTAGSAPAPSGEPAATLSEKLSLLPDRPGCYLFRDVAGTILYVGKALSLRNRVRSYFRGGLEGKTAVLVSLIADFEVIVTDSEVEALVLENNLIKQHRPRYNIRLRDDKQYPYLRLQTGDPWPRLELVRQPKPDGARYFGPYPHSSAVWETMQILRRVFPYRSCSDRRLDQRHACLYHHIHRCLAPCVSACTPDDYRAMIGEMVQFLEGRGEGVLVRLRARMEAAAEDLRFEEAAGLRDRLQALQSVLERQKVQIQSSPDRDVLAVARGNEGDAAVQVFFYRDGKLSGRDGFILVGAEGRSDTEVMEAFIQQFYGGGAIVPREILLPVSLFDPAEIEALLRSRRGGAVALRVPRRGEKKQLVDMVRKNAEEYLSAEQWRRDKSREAIGAALEELRQALCLAQLPLRIECYDNSNMQGTHPVSAMVVFEDGLPKKSEYRKFRVKTVVGADDFATMQEILTRRFSRAARERQALAAANPEGEVPAAAAEGFARLPDLVIIDGGKGQLSSARAAMRDLGVQDIPTFGLAKENEWLFAEGRSDPIILPRQSHGLRLLQRARDEAHRFGLGFHRQLRGKEGVASVLEEIPGIGPKRRKALLKAFGSLAAIRAASVEAVAAIPGMSRPVAEELIAYMCSFDPGRRYEKIEYLHD